MNYFKKAAQFICQRIAPVALIAESAKLFLIRTPDGLSNLAITNGGLACLFLAAILWHGHENLFSLDKPASPSRCAKMPPKDFDPK